MLSNYVVFFWGYKAIINILFGIIIISIILGIILVLGWVTECFDFEIYSWDEDEVKEKKAKDKALLTKIIKITSLVFVISFFTLLIVPSKNDIMAYIGLRYIDEYNMTAVDSNYNIENWLKNSDEFLKKMQKFIENNIGENNE